MKSLKLLLKQVQCCVLQHNGFSIAYIPVLDHLTYLLKILKDDGKIEAMMHIRADCYFMGVTGVDVEAGLSTGDLEEAHIKKALSKRAADTIVLASKEKLGVASSYVVMPLVNASGIVLDTATPSGFAKQMRKAGLDVYGVGA